MIITKKRSSSFFRWNGISSIILFSLVGVLIAERLFYHHIVLEYIIEGIVLVFLWLCRIIGFVIILRDKEAKNKIQSVIVFVFWAIFLIILSFYFISAIKIYCHFI